MFLEIILSASTIAFFSFFALRPTAVTIAELIRDVREKEEIANKMDEKIQNLGKAHLAFDSEGASIGQVEFSVPSNPQPETLVRQIEALATSNPELDRNTISEIQGRIFFEESQIPQTVISQTPQPTIAPTEAPTASPSATPTASPSASPQP